MKIHKSPNDIHSKKLFFFSSIIIVFFLACGIKGRPLHPETNLRENKQKEQQKSPRETSKKEKRKNP